MALVVVAISVDVFFNPRHHLTWNPKLAMIN
jgi:hypothetical protein